MKAEDLKTKTTDELQKLLLDARKEQLNQRFQISGGQLEKTASIRETRRSIARIKTFLSQQKETVAAPASLAKDKTAGKAKTTKSKAA